MVALGPLFAALVLAGPVAGFLLSRYSPRTLVGFGVVAVGLADGLLWLISTPSAGYLAFIVPCLLVGAGFVIATTVRTAIIFASVPRGLPATAAALNESSLAAGNRVGIVMVTAIVAQVALATFTASVASLPANEAQQAIAGFQTVLTAIGTPSFADIAAGVQPADVQPYIDAYVAGVRAAFGLGVDRGPRRWGRGLDRPGSPGPAGVGLGASRGARGRLGLTSGDRQDPARVVDRELVDLRVADAGRPEPRQEHLVEVDVAVALVALELGVMADVLAEQDPVRVAA